MTDGDQLLTHLHEALRELKAAAALAPSSIIASEQAGAIAQALTAVDATIDAVTRQIFAEGTTRPLPINPPLKLKRPSNPSDTP